MTPYPASSSAASRRILMTADTVGGVWTYALELTRALALHGMDVVMATMGTSMTREQRQEASAIPNLEVRESAYKLEWMESPWSEVAAAGDWLLDLERRYQPDLVHLNGYAHGTLSWQAPVVVVGHSCVVSWWRAVHGCAPPSEWEPYRRAVAAGLQGADLVIAPSRAMLQALVEYYGPLPRTRVIANGRKLLSLRPQPKEKMVLTAGRLYDKAKNLAALSAIAPELPWPVYAAGEPAPEATGNAPKDGIHFLGRLSTDDLVSWLSGASIFALPARYEPFGLSTLEAALAGCALVLGDIASLREIWGDAAVFVHPEEPKALCAALKGLMEEPGRLNEMAARAGAVAAHYAPERMAASYMLAYRDVLLRPRAENPREALAA